MKQNENKKKLYQNYFTKNIEDEKFHDLTIIQKIEFLLRDDLKSFERLNSAKYSNEGYSLLHMAAKTNRTKLCTYLVDRIFTSKE